VRAEIKMGMGVGVGVDTGQAANSQLGKVRLTYVLPSGQSLASMEQYVVGVGVSVKTGVGIITDIILFGDFPPNHPGPPGAQTICHWKLYDPGKTGTVIGNTNVLVCPGRILSSGVK
jgi:hypothetical protein